MGTLRRTAFAIICFIGLFTSCNDSFDPIGIQEPRMVLYSILSTETDTQYVRVFSNYFPEGSDPSKNPSEAVVKNATVVITDGVRNYSFHDTLLTRPDTSRYMEPIHAYVAYRFKPEGNKTYTVTVTSPTHGTVSSSTRIPGRSVLTIENFYLLEDPYRYSNLSPTVSFTLSPVTSAYTVKMFLEFEAQRSGVVGIYRREVPESMKPIICAFDLFEYTYPPIKRKLNPPVFGAEFRDSYRFTYFAYRRSIEFVYQTSLNPVFKRVIYYTIQFDENWYRYYTTARTFRDRFSMRLDEPDFTNIRGGVGLFASIAVDSVSWKLPEAILPGDPQGISNCK